MPLSAIADLADLADLEVIVDQETLGYAHVVFGGRCGSAVTRADIERIFYHPIFGGRAAWATGGCWGAIRHTD